MHRRSGRADQWACANALRQGAPCFTLHRACGPIAHAGPLSRLVRTIWPAIIHRSDRPCCAARLSPPPGPPLNPTPRCVSSALCSLPAAQARVRGPLCCHVSGPCRDRPGRRRGWQPAAWRMLHHRLRRPRTAPPDAQRPTRCQATRLRRCSRATPPPGPPPMRAATLHSWPPPYAPRPTAPAAPACSLAAPLTWTAASVARRQGKGSLRRSVVCRPRCRRCPLGSATTPPTGGGACWRRRAQSHRCWRGATGRRRERTRCPATVGRHQQSARPSAGPWRPLPV